MGFPAQLIRFGRNEEKMFCVPERTRSDQSLRARGRERTKGIKATVGIRDDMEE